MNLLRVFLCGNASCYCELHRYNHSAPGFAKSEGLNEAAIGLILAGGAVFGIVGTLVFPRLRARVGLRRTGLIAFAVDIGCLLLCVGSIFAPGSPFAPTVPTAVGGGEPVVWGGNATRLGPAPGGNATGGEMGGEDGREWTSIALLMTGIVVSRIGTYARACVQCSRVCVCTCVRAGVSCIGRVVCVCMRACTDVCACACACACAYAYMRVRSPVHMYACESTDALVRSYHSTAILCACICVCVRVSIILTIILFLINPQNINSP